MEKVDGKPKFGQIYFVDFCRTSCFERVFLTTNNKGLSYETLIWLHYWQRSSLWKTLQSTLVSARSILWNELQWRKYVQDACGELLQHFSWSFYHPSNVWNSHVKRHIKSWKSHGKVMELSRRHSCGNPVVMMMTVTWSHLTKCKTNSSEPCKQTNKLSTLFPGGGFQPPSVCSKDANQWFAQSDVMPWATGDEFNIIPKIHWMNEFNVIILISSFYE